MKKIIKGISVLLTVCLLLSVTGISALAETPPEDKMVTKEPKPESVEVDVVVDAPPVETPTGQTSPAETPTAQTSTAEASTTQTSTVEASTTQTSTAEASTAQTSAGEASTAQTSAGEASTAQTSTAEASTAQTSDAVVPAEASAPAVNDGTPASEESESKEPASEESESKEPASEESESKEPASEEAESEKSASEEPASEESESKEPASEESESKEPASEESASEESASEESASEESASKEPESKEPASEESESKEPASEEPTSEKPASEELESKEPASEEPAGKEPVSEKPDTQQADAVSESPAVLRSAELRVGDHMITVTGELPEGTELKVVKIPEDVVTGMTGKKTLFTYDICLMLDGQVWQPEDYGKDVEVTISNAADAGGEDDISILHVKASVIDREGKLSEGALAAALKGLADGSVGKENLSTDKSSNGFSFRTSSFSLYLAEMKNSGQSVLLVSNSENAGDSEAEAEQNGIVLKGEGSFDILVTGTLETEGTPVLISKEVTPENVSITVWKIDGAVKDAEGEEHVVAEGTPGTEPKTITDDSREVERSIHYIIRVEPSQQDMIGLSGTEEVHGYDTATENSTVTLKVRVPDGYTLTGAYNGEGEKIALEKDPDGNYYVEVPRGGGVFLSVELEKDEDHDTDWGDWSYSWSPCSEKNEDKDRFCIVSFDFNGGTLNGSAGPVFTRVEIGETVTLLDAPTRPGYRFVRWASSPEVSVSMPGESFTLTECVRFVAVWDGPAWPVGGDHDDDDDDDDDDEDEGPDVTETVRIDQDSDEELNLSSVRVTGEKATGIEILSATQEIDVDRDVTVKGGTGGAAGIDITAAGRTVTDEVEIGDGMTVSAAGGNAAGIQTAASAGGQIDLLIQGDTGVSSDSGTSTGIAAFADSSSGVAIVIEGDLITKG